MSNALAGIRVLEWGNRSLSLAGRILADLGAEVILVEPPTGAPIRHEGPFLDDQTGEERAFAHLYMNANKRSVVLDVEQHPDAFRALADTADVLLESAPPGSADALLDGLHPRLIRGSVTPFGLDNPWRLYKANDLIAGAAGGLIQISGSPSGAPVQGGAHPSYTMSSLSAASAIMIALHQRDTDAGLRGAHIDISMQEATALAVMQTQSPGLWQWHGRIPRRPGLSAAMPCKDGKFVGLLVRPDRFEQFLAWAEQVGIDHGMTTDDWRWARLEAPRQGNPVAETTVELSRRLTRDEFVAGALEADIICLPVLDFPDLEQQEQYRVNQEFDELAHDKLDRSLGFVRSPVNAMADGVTISRAPLLGEHQALLNQSKPSPHAGDASAVSAEPLPDKALHGLRVVDFGWVLAAPIGTRILASYGAEVLRVESSTKPDSMRSQIGPDGKPDADMGGLFNVVNAGKKSLSINLSRDEGMQVVKDLIRTADVVVNNFRPGAMERMGLGYDVLKALKPDIVLLNLPGAHRQGPWAQRPSMGNILMAASGFNMLTGFPEERPRGIGVAYPDFTSPHLLVATVLAAIRQRQQTGAGQELHLTQLSGVLSLLGAEWMQFKATGKQPPRNANRSPNYCPHGVYRTLDEPDPGADAWIAIAVQSDDEWRALCDVMAQPQLAADPRFASLVSRKANEDELDAIIGEWAATQEKWALTERLQATAVAAAPVEHLRDMLETDPQLHRHYQQVQQPVAPDVNIPVDREAARWRGQPHDLVRAPGLGEHNVEIVQEMLGYSDEQLAQLIIDDVLS